MYRELSHKTSRKRQLLMKQLESTLTPKEWEDCKLYFNNVCAYCGQPQKDRQGIHHDHFIALNNGGPYTKNNIVTSCVTCNSSKGDSDFFEWYVKQSFYSEERKAKILKYLGIDEAEEV